MQRMLRRTEFAEKITTRGVYHIWHCNVASRVTKSLEAPKKGIDYDLIRKLGWLLLRGTPIKSWLSLTIQLFCRTAVTWYRRRRRFRLKTTGFLSHRSLYDNAVSLYVMMTYTWKDQRHLFDCRYGSIPIIIFITPRGSTIKTQYKRYEKLNTPSMQHQNEHTHTHTHTHKKIKSKEIKKVFKISRWLHASRTLHPTSDIGIRYRSAIDEYQ